MRRLAVACVAALLLAGCGKYGEPERVRPRRQPEPVEAAEPSEAEDEEQDEESEQEQSP